MHEMVASLLKDHFRNYKDDSRESLIALFEKADRVLPNNIFVMELVDVLTSVGVDTTDLRFDMFDEMLKEQIQAYKNDPKRDKANSWSRLNWFMDSIPFYGFGYYDIRDHILSEANHLGLRIRSIPLECSWDGFPDYDIGWFNVAEYRKAYL